MVLAHSLARRSLAMRLHYSILIQGACAWKTLVYHVQPNGRTGLAASEKFEPIQHPVDIRKCIQSQSQCSNFFTSTSHLGIHESRLRVMMLNASSGVLHARGGAGRRRASFVSSSVTSNIHADDLVVDGPVRTPATHVWCLLRL